MEVLVSLVILSIALLAVVRANVFIQDSLKEQQEELKATFFAQSIKAYLHAYGIREYERFPVNIQYDDFQYNIQIEPTNIENLWDVKVTIYKQDIPINQIEEFFWSEK